MKKGEKRNRFLTFTIHNSATPTFEFFLNDAIPKELLTMHPTLCVEKNKSVRESQKSDSVLLSIRAERGRKVLKYCINHAYSSERVNDPSSSGRLQVKVRKKVTKMKSGKKDEPPVTK